MEDTDMNEFDFAADNTKGAYRNEKIITRSVSASSKINEWEKSRPKSWVVVAVPAAIALIIFFCATTAEDYSIRRSFSTPGMQFLVAVCLALAAFLLYCDQKAKKANSQIVSDARKKASKENIVVTNQRIYGSTEKNAFSIPLSKIKETYIQRLDNQNTKISDEILRIISQNETLTFEFLENNAEISNTINSFISYPQSGPTPTASPEHIETYTIELISYSSLIPAVAAIRNITGMDFATAKDYLGNLPAVLAENIPLKKAEDLCNKLENGKVKFEIYQS